jgi:hypothetical protein
LDEEVWRSAAVIDDFVQQEPSEGDPATERTVARNRQLAVKMTYLVSR